MIVKANKPKLNISRFCKDRITTRIRAGILAREFEDNARMERLDVLFASRFIDAYEYWKKRQKHTES